jgi:hypothetical protein
MEKKFIKALVSRDAQGKMTAVATDETMDRHGESLPVDAWDFSNFIKNPVLQFAHDYYSPPIGVAKNIRREGTAILFDPVFHEITQFAKEIKKMYQEGIMSAFSVGFIPHEGDKPRLELLEISAVPVPANPSAVVIDKSIKEIKDDDKKAMDEWLKNELKEKQPINIEDKEWEKEMKKLNDDIHSQLEEIRILKESRVLSAANREAITAAITALNAVLTADDEAQARRDEKKSIDSNIKKGRTPNTKIDGAVLEAALGNVEKQLGFICRTLKKK